MPQQNQLNNVIEGLEAFRGKAVDLLKDSQHLALMVEHSLNQITNKLKHAAGASFAGPTATASDKKPSHILGIPIDEPPKRLNTEALKPEASEKTQLQELTDQAFTDFQIMEPGQLKDSYGDLIIRAVAVKAGMTEVSSTNPEKINVPFIREVIAAVKDKAATDKAEAEAAK